jgi:hypothetical protein
MLQFANSMHINSAPFPRSRRPIYRSDVAWNCGGKEIVVTSTKQRLEIENLRNHPEETVERLRELRNSGARAREDSRRRNFFEIDDADQVFYVYISPVSGRVTLLATWARQSECVAG